ncbi:MAG: hypothetical protein Q9218_006475, partial [Villophora microphyllina]
MSHSIIIGAVEGAFPAVLGKISKLHSKNSFSLAIVLGDFFPDPERTSEEDADNVSRLIAGKIDIPLPTYFTLGRHPLPASVIGKLEKSDDELCPNLYFLGKRSTTKTSEGIRIVNLGGALDSAITAGLSKEKYLPFHTEDDAKSLRGANFADILITTHWPSDVRRGSKVVLPDSIETPAGEQCAADLCAALRPRYHFSTSNDAFYEREPFFHLPTETEPETKPITRFISLASTNNSSKQKSLYAFSIDATASPVTTSQKRQRLASQHQSYSRFSSNTNHDGDHHRSHKRRRNDHYHPPPGPQDCFFCLSNPTIKTHLITSIANDTYLTIAK